MTNSPARSNAADTVRVDAGPIRRVCVYCGSGKGLNPLFKAAAQTLGRDLAAADIELVYGGGSLGLMGETARAVLENGGRVTGIIPEFLSDREKMLEDVQELIVTQDMHERKRLMFERSDAIVALPGGIGTLEELVEQLTWSQLGQHVKPICLADIDGFWKPLLDLLEHMRGETFIREGLEVDFLVAKTAEKIVPTLLDAANALPVHPDQRVIEREEIGAKL
ncbi:MAG: TIGR00730 family Rossman fold protein [Pseudomonadota bacterium]